LIHHYTAVGYFFSGQVNTSQFYLRKIKSFRNTSNFAIIDILSIFNNANIKIPSTSSTIKEDSILRDILFESQDFRHSFTFELV